MQYLSCSQEIKGLREELASRLNSNETLELIREKEEQIRELLEEGESLRLFNVFSETWQYSQWLDKNIYCFILAESGSLLRVCLFTCFFWLGEKLSKQQLQHSNIIKKLRVKERESDAQITKQTKKLKEQEEELKHLQQVRDTAFKAVLSVVKCIQCWVQEISNTKKKCFENLLILLSPKM